MLKWNETLSRWAHNPRVTLGRREHDHRAIVLTVSCSGTHTDDGFHLYIEWNDGSLIRDAGHDTDVDGMAKFIIREPLDPINKYSQDQNYSIPDGLHTKDLQELSEKLVAVNEWMNKAYEAVEGFRELSIASQKLKDSFEDAMASKLDKVLRLAWAECDKILVGRFSRELAEKRRGKDRCKRRQELYNIIRQAEQELEG